MDIVDQQIRRPWIGLPGELVWNLSLTLYDLALCGNKRWWWRLHWELYHLCSIDEDQLVLNDWAKAPRSLAYGDTPCMSVLKSLKKARTLREIERLCDLGSGQGMVTLTAANLGIESVGLEWFSLYADRCDQIARKLKLPASYRCADFLSEPWPQADLYWLTSTAFSQEVRDQLEEKMIQEVPSQSLILTHDWNLENQKAFEWKEAFWVPVTWGGALTQIYQKV